MKNMSYWQKTAVLPTFAPLQENTNIDVAIIGGGITGIMCAYYLRNSGKKIAVFEQGKLAHLTTAHTTAKISFLHKTIYQYLEKHYSLDAAALYLESNTKAMQEIETIINENDIDCDYRKNSAFVYTKEKKNIARIENEIETLTKLGVDVLVNQHQESSIYSSVGVTNQAIFHPLKYLTSIIQACIENDIVFYENSMAHDFVKDKDHTNFICNKKYVTTNTVIFATRYPQILFPKLYFLRLSQTREIAWFMEANNSVEDSYLSVDTPVESFRPTTGGIIHGGYEHEIGVKAPDYLYPITSSNPTFWCAQDSKANRGIPYIGYFSSDNKDWLLACGFNKWGMTLSHVSAKLISDLILNKTNAFEQLYSINTSSISATVPAMKKIVTRSFTGFIKNRFVFSTKHLYKGEGKVMRIHGRLRAVYKDDNGALHSISPFCQHLKCIVNFNSIEKTWDCPCHGSRYDIKGHIIEGPSVKHLK